MLFLERAPFAGQFEIPAAIERAQVGVALEERARRGDNHMVALERGELIRLVRLDKTKRAGFAGAEHQIIPG